MAEGGRPKNKDLRHTGTDRYFRQPKVRFFSDLSFRQLISFLFHFNLLGKLWLFGSVLAQVWFRECNARWTRYAGGGVDMI